MLLNFLQQIFRKELTPANYGSFRTEVCWTQLKEEGTLYFVMTNPSRAREFWNFSHFFRMEAWPVHSFARHFDLPAGIGDSDISQLTPKSQTSTRSPTSRALAVSWLSQCRANEAGKHRECNKRDGDYLPTRLLDVKYAQETSRLRLVCPALTPAPFDGDREWMTLSYCWGAWGAKENPILKKSNLEERQRTGLKVADLPKTLQDAVEIAGGLDSKWSMILHAQYSFVLTRPEVNWLWIDCLCIVQDSASDWFREATSMSQIYQNAVLNVSADSGIDSRAGCFIERDQLDITPLEIHSPQLSQSWKLLPVATFLFDWMAKTPSFSRAWIHRERQLARRVLHFTDTELVWECCGIEGTSFASEMLPGGAPFKRGLFDFNHKYQIGRLQQGLAEGTEETYATWNDICEKLSEKNLTNPSDMPIVLSGLAKDFAHVLPPADEYVGGLWRSMLPQSLLWHTRGFNSHDLEYIAPSWSWLSTDCAVTLASRSQTLEKHSVATIIHISTKLKYKDAYGPLESGTLEVEGILRRVQLSFEYETQLFNVSVLDHEGDNEGLRAIGSSWDEYYGDMCKLQLDAVVEEPDLDCFCIFITIQQLSDQSSYREIGCLLLKRVGEEGSTFTRIGTLVLMDLYALKMRYRLDEDVEEDDWEVIQRRIEDVQDQAIQAEKQQKKKRGEGQSEAAPTDATGDTTSNVARKKHPQGLDALYQFDDAIDDLDWLERLSPQILTIV